MAALLFLLYWALATSAPTCSEIFCPLAWVRSTQRGDGFCDLSCNTALCGFDGGQNFNQSDCYQACTATASLTESLGNSECDLDWASEVCAWDAGDCGYCAEGCKTYAGLESELGNGECEEACNTAVCGFDGGDCVTSRQGYCNSGCFQPMLEDEVCQMECLVETCQYNQASCEASLCAPGCYPELQGDGECQPECYSKACSWDLSDCDCAPNCLVDMLGNGFCDSACYVETCAWDWTDCECAQGCPYSELGTGKEECLVPACNFDAWNWTADSCANITAVSCKLTDYFTEYWLPDYVTNFTCGGKAVALPLTYCESVYSIFPVNGRVLPDLSSAVHPVVYYVAAHANASGSGSLTDPFDSLQRALFQINHMYVDFLLAPGNYTISVTHLLSTCSLNQGSYITVPLQYFPAKRVRIRSADCEVWQPDCQRPVLLLITKNLCMMTLLEDFALEFDNVNFTADNRFCSLTSICPPAFFNVAKGALLGFTNVTFRSLAITVPISMISLVHGKVELSNVDFLGISLKQYGTNSFMGVIASNSSAEVVYRGGRVTLLNNNINYLSSFIVKGFINLQHGSVLLEGVQFSYNYVSASVALIAFRECDKCVIANCVFENNFGTVLRYTATDLQAFSADWKKAKTIASRALEIVNCVFRNNTGQGSGSVEVQFASVLHSVVARNCSFTNELAEVYGVLVIASSGFSSTVNFGFWKWAYSSNSAMHKVTYPAVHISLHDLTFENCTVGSYGLLVFAHLPYLHLSNISTKGYGAFSNVNRFTNTFNAFLSQPKGRIPLSLPTISLSPCLSIVNFTSVYDLAIEGFAYRQFECYYGVYFANCTKGVLTNLAFVDNVATEVSGAALFIHLAESLVLSNIVFNGNRNEAMEGRGTFQITESNWISVQNGQFVGNKAHHGGVLYCYGKPNLSILNSTFHNNSAQVGGVLYLDFPPSVHSTIDISASEFTGNSASELGGVLAFGLAAGVSFLSLYIRNSTFSENSSVLGSVLHISRSVLLEQGLVADSRVAGNRASQEGTLHLAAGNLSLASTCFEGNSAKDGSGVYRKLSSDFSYGLCTLSCFNVSLLGNTGNAVISLLPSFQLKAFTARDLLCRGNLGACLSLDSTIAQCHYCEFRENRAVSGASFLLIYSNLTMSHSKCVDNAVTGNGGAGVLGDVSSLLCQHCEFANNTARRQGGALYLKDSDARIFDSNFSGNSALEGGFALSLYRSNSLSLITNTQFTGHFGDEIGTISLLLAKISFVFCRIARNQYSKLTGGMNVYLSDVVLQRCEFSQQSSYSGSFLYVSQSVVQIESSSFSEGRAASTGGAAALLSSKVNLFNCTLSNLTAELGAAFFLQSDSQLLLNQCELKSISVGKTGRGVVNGYRSTIHVLNTHFSHFTQSAIAGQDAELVLLGSTFQEAVGNYGGAVSCIDCRLVRISDTTFRNITAVRGGAVYLSGSAEQGMWTAGNLIAEKCEATEGGAIFAANCSLVIVGSAFVDNKAVGDRGRGGAVLFAAGESDRFEVRECFQCE